MTRDLAASVRQKLLDRSKSEGRPFQELLHYYAMERFLYRLANSPHAERFILKGALLLAAWQAPQSRSTVDIDLEGRLNNDPETMTKVIRDVCRIAATFRNRSTPIERQPVGLMQAFANDPAKIKQWGAFRSLQRSVVVPEKLEDVVASIADFCLPVLASVAEGGAFQQTWNPGARWEKISG